MQYLVVSYSHKNTDIEVREKLAFSDDTSKIRVLKKLLETDGVYEALILSTCNRVEVLVSTSIPSSALRVIFDILHNHSGLSIEELEGRADVYEDEGAVHHIFSVASSLDSLVVGETQIAGQLKDAYKFSLENNFCSHNISRLIQYSFKCAAEVRNSTDISKNPVSVAGAAVSQAKALLSGDLGGLTALVVGAGEMSEIVTRHLVANGCNVILFNRTLENAKKIAAIVGKQVEIKSLDALTGYINRYKLLFSATGASDAIVKNSMVKATPFDRYWFDLAVPRDIEDINESSIKIFAVDDLKEIVDTNLSLRKEQARRAYEIVGRYTMDYFKILQALMIEPLIKDIRIKAKKAAIEEVERAVKKGFISAESKENVEKLVLNAFNKFLHIPTKQLKEVVEQPKADTIIEAMKFIFKVDMKIKLNGLNGKNDKKDNDK